MNNSQLQHGYIALISVLIVSAIGVAIAVSLLLLGLGSSQSSHVAAQSAKARNLANACVDYALEQLLESLSYAGDETLSLAQGDCHILAVEGSGNNNRLIKVTSTVNTVVRKVQVSVSQVKPTLQLDSWQEVADF